MKVNIRLIATLSTTFLLGALTSGCTIENPEMPIFSTTIHIPLGNDSITAFELVEDEDFISVHDDSVIGFSVDGDTTSMELEFDYGADIEATEIQAEIGVITLDGIAPIEYGFQAEEISQLLKDLPPGIETIPAFTFDIDGQPADIDGIFSANIQSGEISITLTNELPIAISGLELPERIEIELFNGESMETFAVFVFDEEILPSEFKTKSIDLAGRILPGSLAVIITGGSAGGNAPEGILPEHSLEVEIELSDLEVVDAMAEIGAQLIETSESLALPDSLGLIRAEIGAGELAINFANELVIPCTVELQFDELHNPDGSLLLIAMNLLPGESTSSITSLENSFIESIDSNILSELNYTVSTSTPGSNGEIVQISSSDFVSLSIASSRITLASITGELPFEIWELDSVSEEIEMPEDFDGIHLSGAQLVVNIDNETGISGEIDFTITGYCNNGLIVTVNHQDNIIPTNNEFDGKTVITLNESNSNINELISEFPNRLEFSGNISIGGNGEIGSIRNGDQASVSWNVSAPLSFSMESSTIETDPEYLNLDYDTRTNLRDNLVSGELQTIIDNSFPFGVELNLFLGTDTLTLIEYPEAIIGPITVAPGYVDPETGWVTESVCTTNTIIITQSTIDLISSESACSALFINIPGTSGETVSVRVNDGINFSGIVSAEILINEDLR
jgi:hypothetical protein